MIVFDIQPQQKEGVAQLTKANDLPVRQLVPIVTMRVDNIDGITQEMHVGDSARIAWRAEQDKARAEGREPEEPRRGDDDLPWNDVSAAIGYMNGNTESPIGTR
ncbi:MAG: hypothetical protein R2788_04865 [Saprospiraceae bacterium]